MPGNAQSLLIIDDDKALCKLMAQFFSSCDFQLTAAHDGPTGLRKALSGSYDLIILDWMLPFLNGLEVLGQIRRASKIPVIMLTARRVRGDRIAGLDAGADDYLSKPFAPQELLARIRAVLRRTDPAPVVSKPVCVGNLRLEYDSREVWNGDKPVDLTSYEFAILDVLMRSAGKVVSRDELAAVLHQRIPTPYERALDVHICHLRKKLETDGQPLIRSVWGVGYTLAARE